MNKKMREIFNEIKDKQAQARTFQDAGETQRARDCLDEIKDLQKKYDTEKELYDLEKNGVPDDPKNAEKADGFSILCKVARRQRLNEAEAALITGGDNGEDYIIPEDVRLEIIKLRRKYKSAAALVNNIPTNSITGSFNFEDGEPTTLTDFSDGETLTDSDDPKIKQKTFECKQWGNIIGISNRLIGTEKAQLMSYIDTWFVKKAILTENLKIFTELKKDKTAVACKSLDDFLKIMITEIDPAFEGDMRIITNQNGLYWMATQTDADGNKLLMRDVSNPAIKRFNGAMVEVFPNKQLPNTGNKVPFFIGNIADGCYFVTHEQYSMAASEHALFNKNQKALRIIEDFDVIGADKDAYVFAEVDTTAAAASTEDSGGSK